MQAFLKAGKSLQSTDDKLIPSTSGSATHIESTKTLAPWVEKYRPKNIEDVVEQAEVVEVLRQCVDNANLPNILLYGPPGTGKTSTILAAARQLFGDIYKDRILELNASDERGINVVRSKIKHFAQLTASSLRPDGKPCPPFKIIILDEADSMTHAAQAALRRTMEKECRSTRFCLICNYISKIIEPITSRCTKFRFKAIGDEKIIDRLKYICKEENLTMAEDTFELIVKMSDGDMRKAITTLQSCYRLKEGGIVTNDDLFEFSGRIPEKYLTTFLEICKSGNYSELEEYVQNLNFEAYSVGQMMEQFNEFILKSDVSEKQKSIICEKLSECLFRLQEGGSEYLQIMNLGCSTLIALK